MTFSPKSLRRYVLFAPLAFMATTAHAATGEAVNPWVALAYLVAGVFFILALRGLSSPATSRTGNRFPRERITGIFSSGAPPCST